MTHKIPQTGACKQCRMLCTCAHPSCVIEMHPLMKLSIVQKEAVSTELQQALHVDGNAHTEAPGTILSTPHSLQRSFQNYITVRTQDNHQYQNADTKQPPVNKC